MIGGATVSFSGMDMEALANIPVEWLTCDATVVNAVNVGIRGGLFAPNAVLNNPSGVIYGSVIAVSIKNDVGVFQVNIGPTVPACPNCPCSKSSPCLALTTTPAAAPIISYDFNDAAAYALGKIPNLMGSSLSGNINFKSGLVSGFTGTALNFNDVDTFFTVPGSGTFQFTNGFGVDMLVMRYGITAEDALFSKWTGNDQVYLRFVKNTLSFSIKSASGTRPVTTISYNIPDDCYLDQWVRITASYTPSASGTTIKLAWNCVVVAQTTISGKF
jgi:hypothetical protein